MACVRPDAPETSALSSLSRTAHPLRRAVADVSPTTTSCSRNRSLRRCSSNLLSCSLLTAPPSQPRQPAAVVSPAHRTTRLRRRALRDLDRRTPVRPTYRLASSTFSLVRRIQDT